MADDSGSAISGGLLVVLGIIVAVGLGFFFLHGRGASGPDISVNLPGTSSTR